MSNYHFLEKTVIDKGWSGDVKYCAVDETGQKYLLRVSPREQYDRKRGTFEMMQRTAALGIPMCRALEFGECSDGVYMVQTWIDGEDSEQALPRYSLKNASAFFTIRTATSSPLKRKVIFRFPKYLSMA